MLAVSVLFGPMVMIKSCVRVRPAANSGELPVLADTRTSFQVGVMLPLVTMMNLISSETVSDFAPFPLPPPEPPDALEAMICVTSASVKPCFR